MPAKLSSANSRAFSIKLLPFAVAAALAGVFHSAQGKLQKKLPLPFVEQFGRCCIAPQEFHFTLAILIRFWILDLRFGNKLAHAQIL